MYEYKVVPGPEEPGKKLLGRVKFSYIDAFSDILNELGLDDWEYQQSEFGPDNQRLLVFRRRVRKLEEDLPELTMHAPPRPEREDVKPRSARSLLDEGREAIERLKAERRKVIITQPQGDASVGTEKPAEATSNVADILSAKIAKAQSQKQN